MQPRFLVIRGGAIGDFVLTLPAIALIREHFPSVDLEILGYKHIVALAENRFYATATRSIEYAGMARFFMPDADLPDDLADYFAGFNHVLTYLFDPDGIFETNLKRAGVKNILSGSPHILPGSHATAQLAKPLEHYALYLENPEARLFPSDSDVEAAQALLHGTKKHSIIIHPGSGGGNRKNWPIDRWITLLKHVHAGNPHLELIAVGGEADVQRMAQLRECGLPIHFLSDVPLPHLAAAMSRASLFVGHDSGISHMAAAVGVPCLLLFGPTDPEVWAPQNPGVTVLRSSTGEMSGLTTAEIREALDRKLESIIIS